MTKRKVTWLNVFGYACINFLGSGAQALVSAWLMLFYTSMCGIDAVQAGLIFSVTRLIDAVGNPIMGYISDNFGRTRLGKRFGRRKFFVLIGVPGFLIVYPLMWTTGHSYAFYMVANMLYEMMFTIIIVSAITLPAEMSQDAADKTKLVSAKQYCGTFASTIATFIPGVLFQMLGEKNPQAFFLTGLIYAAITSLSLIVVYLLTFERNPEDIIYTEEMGSIGTVLVKMFTDVFSSMRIRSFRLHALMMFFIGIYKNLAGGIFTYYVIYCLGLTKATTSYITSFTTAVSFIALAAFITLSYKYGGPKAFRVGATVIIASLIGYYAISKMTGSSNITTYLVILAVINTMGKAGADYVPVFQLPFMADIDEAVTFERREGIFSGVNGLLSKVAGAIEGALIGIALTAFGFTKNTETQTAGALDGILILTIVVPIFFLLLTWIVSLRLNLTKENHKILVAEVNRVKAGGAKEEVTPEAKKAIEDLTGWKYEQCFGNNNVVYHTKKAATV